MHDFRRLRVWREARALGTDVYAICAEKGRTDQLITTQLRRSALSIVTNIAEGCGKNSRAETIRYFEIASGSAAETEHHLEVACDVGALSTHRTAPLIERAATVRRMLDSLIVRLPR